MKSLIQGKQQGPSGKITPRCLDRTTAVSRVAPNHQQSEDRR